MTSVRSRELAWEGGANTRDLGGLPLESGGTTRYGRVYRSSNPDVLTAAGWRAAQDAGVVGILDLRGEWEKVPVPLRPEELTVASAPLEDIEEPFYAEWDGKHGSMDYFLAGREHWPAYWRGVADALVALPDGPILVHCMAGRDRTGAVTALLLDGAGVEREAILDDYIAGVMGSPRPDAERDAVLSDAREAMTRFLDAPRDPELDTAFREAATRLL